MHLLLTLIERYALRVMVWMVLIVFHGVVLAAGLEHGFWGVGFLYIVLGIPLIATIVVVGFVLPKELS